MDYKTTTLLTKLIEAIEKLDSPDWWSTGATILAAIVASIITFVLGKRQNKLHQQQLELQEQQNKLQKQQIMLQKQQNAIQCYEIYKNTQQVFASINFFARFLLPDILHYLKHDYRPNADIHLIEQMSDQIAAYNQELDDRIIDVDIHLSHWPIFEYEDLLGDMRAVVDDLKKIIAQGGIVQPKTTIDRPVQEDEDYYVELIASYIADEFLENYKNTLYEFVTVREDVLSYDASAILQAIYNPDRCNN